MVIVATVRADVHDVKYSLAPLQNDTTYRGQQKTKIIKIKNSGSISEERASTATETGISYSVQVFGHQVARHTATTFSIHVARRVAAAIKAISSTDNLENPSTNTILMTSKQ
jgi:hypothetical protein